MEDDFAPFCSEKYLAALPCSLLSRRNMLITQGMLHRAMIQENLGRLKGLLRSLKNVKSYESNVITSLHYAVSTKNIDIMELLLSRRAISNTIGKIKHYYSLFQWACIRGSRTIVEIFLNFGHDVNFYCDMDFMCKKEEPQIIRPLQLAMRKKNTEVISLLLERGANVDIRNSKGQTPLHIASGKDDFYEIFEDLIKYEPNVNALDHNNNTPLHLACLRSFDPVCSVLIDNGADINVTNSKGKTPLDIAMDKYNCLAERRRCPREKVDAAKKVVDRLMEHLMKMYTADLSLSESNMKFTSLFRCSDMNKCKTELQFMQDFVLHKHITLSDIFKGNLRQVASCISEKKAKAIFLKDFSTDLPFYGKWLKNSMTKLERLYELKKAKVSICELTGFKLPEECAESICDHLNMIDLQKLGSLKKKMRRLPTVPSFTSSVRLLL